MDNLDATDSHPNAWTIIGSPLPGMMSALAIGLHENATIFAGTRSGLYKTNALDQPMPHWQSVPGAPLEIITLALSPTYAADQTILVGGGQGLLISLPLPCSAA